MEVKLVLTGDDYKEGKEKKNLLSQIKESLKKFVGRSVIGGEKEKVKAVESTYVTREEMTLLLKQNKKKRKFSNSEQKEGEGRNLGEGRNPNYKGKKNPLGSDFLPLKCFGCKCQCTTNCSCKCRYHMKQDCPELKKKDQLSLFMKSNTPNFDQDDSTETYFTTVMEGETQDNQTQVPGRGATKVENGKSLMGPPAGDPSQENEEVVFIADEVHP